MADKGSVLSEAASLRQWNRAVLDNPYDRTARERLAAVLLSVYGDEQPPGTIARGRALLGLIRASSPTPELSAAYFANLEAQLAGVKPLARPGRLVLALGPGRCGSTSLAAILATIDGSCCTHENPPLIFWQPCEEQVAFHVRRLAFLRRYFALVFDAAHWWLNVADRLRAEFPDLLLLGLWRDPERCADSFLAVKGPYNHWAEPGAGWPPTPWDPTYPSYPSAADTDDRDAEKRRLVQRYIADYYAALAALRQRSAGDFLDLPTERLSEPELQADLFARLGLAGQIIDQRLNAGATADGSQPKFSF